MAVTKILRAGIIAFFISVFFLTGCTADISSAEPVKLGSPPETSSHQSQGWWTGTWESAQWGTMELVQDGDKVTGTYTWEEGKIAGMTNGRMLTGTWSESPTYQPPDDAGDFKFTISDDGTSFTGQWRYGSSGDWQGSWSGEKVQRDSRLLIIE